jgi:hypothetical protein
LQREIGGGGEKKRKKIKNGGSHVWRGGWRVSRNGGWEWEFGRVWKMEVHIEIPLELVFSPNLQILE